jgi:hypothetical protein
MSLIRIRSVRPNLVRDGTLLIGLLAGMAQVVGRLPSPGDAYINWIAGADPDLLYPARWDLVSQTAYVYPPPLAIAIGFLHVLPYEVYVVFTTTLLFASLWYCAGRWTPVIILAGIVGAYVPTLWPLSVPLSYALLGNVQLLLAAAIVVALRHPVAWSLPVLTKIGPGVGLVWHLARREWRSLAVALVACGVVVLVSAAAMPSAWGKYLAFVQRSSDLYIPLPVVPIPWLVRLLMSAALIAWGGITGRAWTVPIGAGWAMPALYPWSFLGIWIGAIRLLDGPRWEPVATRRGIQLAEGIAP